MAPWWAEAVVYQIYPRSFQDADDDGVGDLAGIAARLPYLERLGVDAIWLSPMYPSPLADGGYDVADYCDVDPRLGTLADLDRLVVAAHARGIRVLLDLVPSHTSIEHPWFRAHPDRYIWADGDAPPNNWRAAFGGPAWSRDALSGRWYLHSFYPEQPDLDWRNPAVVAAMQQVVRFWRARGVDGFRIDAIDRILKDAQLRDDEPTDEPPPWPTHQDGPRLDGRYSRGQPDVGVPLGAIRAAAGEDAFLVGEVFLGRERRGPYLEAFDAAFAFELLFAPWDAATLRRALAGAASGSAWVLSNHDFPRLATRLGDAAVPLAALLLLTLPGPVFLYQGDELGLADGPGGPGAAPPYDRAGRDRHRHPMPWDDGPGRGFSQARPWLAVAEAPHGSAAAAERDPTSILALHRRLIALRRTLSGALELLDAPTGVLAYARGAHVVALNLCSDEAPLPDAGEVLLRVGPEGAALPPGGGVCQLRRPGSLRRQP